MSAAVMIRYQIETVHNLTELKLPGLVLFCIYTDKSFVLYIYRKADSDQQRQYFHSIFQHTFFCTNPPLKTFIDSVRTLAAEVTKKSNKLIDISIQIALVNWMQQFLDCYGFVLSSLYANGVPVWLSR